jgi:hypothetical protein
MPQLLERSVRRRRRLAVAWLTGILRRGLPTEAALPVSADILRRLEAALRSRCNSAAHQWAGGHFQEMLERPAAII